LSKDYKDIGDRAELETLLTTYMADRALEIHRDLVIGQFYQYKLDQDREQKHLTAKKIGEIYANSPITEKEAPAQP